MTTVYVLLAVLLLLLNAFFVLAEFAAVKLRATRIEELLDQGHPRAKLVQTIHQHMDEYLAVCQVGITFASIGLGFVGEPAVARLLEPLFAWAGAASGAISHSIAITVAYLLVSYLHIVVGEQVPKSMAIRSAERWALWAAVPLRFFRLAFYLPLLILNSSSNALLRLLGMPHAAKEDHPSEDELRIILERSQTRGLMSFRRLLFVENVFDFGELTVRDAMRPRAAVRVLRAGMSWDEVFKALTESRLSRYPVIGEDENKPIGVLHVKDLLFLGPDRMREVDLKKVARPFVTTSENAKLENLLSDLQRRRAQVALVTDAEGRWTGLITLEDVIEEIVGTVEDEFEAEPPVFLGDALSLGRIVLDLQATSIEDAIRRVLERIPQSELPLPVDRILKAMLERERLMHTYLGRGLALPHGRIEGLDRPFAIFARSPEGVPVKGRSEKAHLLFLLLTPANSPRTQVRLLARIGGLMESEFVEERLREAPTPQEILEAIRAGEAASLG